MAMSNIQIAKYLKGCNPRPSGESRDYNRAWGVICFEFAYRMHRASPSFDIDGFLRECGYLDDYGRLASEKLYSPGMDVARNHP